MHNHSIRQDLLKVDYTYRRLHSEHQEVETALKTLKSAPSVDVDELRRLKQLKLMLKDSMHTIEEKA